MVAAVVGGGIKLLGAEVPVLSSFPRQAMLFVLGLAFLLGSIAANVVKLPAASVAAPSSPAADSAASPAASTPTPSGPAASGQGAGAAPAPPPATVATAPAAAACSQAEALACLPRSSGPVAFADPAAATRAAAQNIRDGLSTSQGEADAIRQGASGKAARLCGILASNDSSPLGKHLAAARLKDALAADGQASGACLTLAKSFL